MAKTPNKELEKEIDAIVTKRLKEYRIINNISLEEVSKRTGLDIETIIQHESGVIPIASSILYFWAKLFNKSIAAIADLDIIDVSKTPPDNDNINPMFDATKCNDSMLSYQVAEDGVEYFADLCNSSKSHELLHEIEDVAKIEFTESFENIKNREVKYQVSKLIDAIVTSQN